jgi:hypothetical protein
MTFLVPLDSLRHVIPAQAGIQNESKNWVPVCAGMT